MKIKELAIDVTVHTPEEALRVSQLCIEKGMSVTCNPEQDYKTHTLYIRVKHYLHDKETIKLVQEFVDSLLEESLEEDTSETF